MSTNRLIKSWRNSAINDVVINESFITGIIWVSPETLKLELDWVGQETVYTSLGLQEGNYTSYLLFEYIWSVNINLQYDDSQIGQPEISEFSFLEFEDGTKQVNIDFLDQPHGKINFRCNDIHFVIEERQSE